MFAPEDFTIDFSTRQEFPGGLYQPVSLASDPLMAALTTGFVQAIYSFEPCGVVFPHVHPRGDENVFVVSGTVDVGFVDEAGALIRNPAIKPGNGFVIPQGYIHYLANPTCEPAQALATVPAADGGSYGALGGVFALPANILLGAVPFVDEIALAGLRKAVAESGVIYVDSFCAAKCAESATGRGSGSAHAGAYGRD